MSVRLVAEGSGDFIGFLPPTSVAHSVGEFVTYDEVGGSAVRYKIERVEHMAEYSVKSSQGSHDSYSVYETTDYIVSVP